MYCPKHGFYGELWVLTTKTWRWIHVYRDKDGRIKKKGVEIQYKSVLEGADPEVSIPN
jgi:hypothetical protein